MNINMMMNLRNAKKFTISAVAGNVLVDTPNQTLDCDYKLGDFIQEIPRLKSKQGGIQNSLLGALFIDSSHLGNLSFRR